MKVRVLYFAALRERVGKGSAEEEIAPGTSVGALWEQLRKRPELAGAPQPGFAVNRAWVRADRMLAEGDEVGLLPPVSGG